MTPEYDAQIGRLTGRWCVRYKPRGEQRAYGRNHYGTLLECVYAWWCVQRGQPIPAYMAPHGKHL